MNNNERTSINGQIPITSLDDWIGRSFGVDIVNIRTYPLLIVSQR